MPYITIDGMVYDGDRQIRGIDPETDQPIYDPETDERPDTRDNITKVRDFFITSVVSLGEIPKGLYSHVADLRSRLFFVLQDLETAESPLEQAYCMATIRDIFDSSEVPDEFKKIQEAIITYIQEVYLG